MKKKIVFMVINMNIGGTEKALLNMINEMPKDQYEITVLMLEKYGGFLDAIPKEVRVEYLEDYAAYKDLLNKPVENTVKNLFKQRQIGKGIALGSVHALSRIFQNKLLYYNFVLKKMPKYKNKYDIAIAYAGPMDFISYFVANKIKATKRIQWIHFDVSKIGFDSKFNSKVYRKFNKIFVVSNEGKEKLITKLPDVATKVETFSNILTKEFIINMAHSGNGFEDNFNGIKILTVGRLSKEKGQDLIIPVLSRLKKNGYKVRWYCIGEGQMRKEYLRIAKEYGLQKDFVLLGSKSNPYPYMQQCDIYVQPSRYEGYCITLAEARCLGCSIISTNFTGAKEQIYHNENGMIIEFNEEELFTALVKLLDKDEIRRKFKKSLRKEVIDSTGELKKLHRIANEC
jgi:glycosyltransferase involved in cell wall biosynthesis